MQYFSWHAGFVLLFLSYIFILFGSQGITFNIAFIGKKDKGKFVLG